MTFPIVNFVDDFNRANADPISGSWADFDIGEVGIRINTNQAAAAAVNPSSDNAKSYFTGTQFNADVDVFVTVAAVPADTKAIALWARIINPDTASLGGYLFAYNPVAATDTYGIAWTLNNVYQGTLTTATGPELVAGDKIGFRCQGSRLTGYIYRTGVWQIVCAVTDTNFKTGGYVGLEIKDIAGTGRVDNFSASNIASGTAPEIIRPHPFSPGLAR